MVLASFVDWAGNGLYLAVLPVYLTVFGVVGSTAYATAVGIGAAAGFVGSVPVGMLADRVGPRQVLVGLELASALACGALALSRTPFWVFLFVALLMSTDRAIAPLVQSLVGGVADEARRVSAMALVRSSANVGVAVGGLGASVALAAGSRNSFRIALLVDAASFVLAALLVASIRSSADRKPVEVKRIGAPWSIADRRFVILAALNGVLGLHKPILLVGLPLWVVHHTRAPHVLVAAIFVLNSALVIALQVRASKGRESLVSAGRTLHQSALIVAAACVLVPVTVAASGPVVVAVLLAATAVITVGELVQSVGAWGVSFALAPEDRRSQYLAVFTAGNIIRDVIGPVLVTALVVGWGGPGWLVLAAVLAAAAAATRGAVRAVSAPTRGAQT